ncbi:conserved hypothetical protein [Ricinus communis]|uniref:Uncharacterized protein n=1 Tax=Ricinus communis TaxID=3988 RepID=B9TJM7_RICCO|nr:conserved hypothetical protein [Ricinus communis]
MVADRRADDGHHAAGILSCGVAGCHRRSAHRRPFDAGGRAGYAVARLRLHWRRGGQQRPGHAAAAGALQLEDFAAVAARHGRAAAGEPGGAGAAGDFPRQLVALATEPVGAAAAGRGLVRPGRAIEHAGAERHHAPVVDRAGAGAGKPPGQRQRPHHAGDDRHGLAPVVDPAAGQLRAGAGLARPAGATGAELRQGAAAAEWPGQFE